MKLFLTFITISTLTINTYGQKWQEWNIDTSFSIIGNKKIEKIRWNNSKKVRSFESEISYFNPCDQLESTIKTTGENHFIPHLKKVKQKVFDAKCDSSNYKQFPTISNNDITYTINYSDSTITLFNNTTDTLYAGINNEWEFNQYNYSIGIVLPNNTASIDIILFFQIHGWLQYIEFRNRNEVLKREILRLN